METPRAPGLRHTSKERSYERSNSYDADARRDDRRHARTPQESEIPAKGMSDSLGVQLAPAPVGAVTYLSVTQGPPDVFAHALIGYGVLQSLILLRLLPWIGAGGFTPSYWAFTFGITALATAPLKLLARGDSGAIADLAGILFGAANLAVAAIMIGTVLLAMRGKLFAKTVTFPRLAHRLPEAKHDPGCVASAPSR
jgi:hypothetical protein